MAGPTPLVLLWALLTLCISAGTPEVWVQVQMEATEFPTFTVRCGFLGSGSISLVTVSCGGPDGAGGTSLAVLHPEFGTRYRAPVRQAHWETKSSISLTLEGSAARSPWANTTFCYKFVSFPSGSQEACGDKGLPAPSPGSLSSPYSAGRPGRDLWSLRDPPVWLHLRPTLHTSAEASVYHSASATPLQCPGPGENSGHQPNLPVQSSPPRYPHHPLPSSSEHGAPPPATVPVGIAPHSHCMPNPGTCHLWVPAGHSTQQFYLC
ncbi:transmembrane protein PVRIG [Callospermophilus lateralis]|uniref:transmembrane protein PVRIG n=1 Tax=Callospermophilus lateralis TaxID=76772 RepID=UPI0040546741